MKNTINIYLEDTSKNFINLKKESSNIEAAINIIINALKKNNKIFFCGNGGSAGDSQHLAAELMGRYKKDRNPLAAIALTVNTSVITAIGNDYGYEKIFSRQLEGIGNSGDVLIGISTSGNSQNIIEAMESAKKKKIKIICFTGNKETKMTSLADCTIFTPSSETNQIQEMHIAIGHLICGIVEEEIFGKS